MIDSFPHYIDTSQRTTMRMIMNDNENGYFKWFSLLESLGQHFNETGDLHFNFGESKELLAKVAAYCNTPTASFISFLDYASEVELIDKDLWKEQIVWIQSFRDSLAKMHSRKKGSFPRKPGEVMDLAEVTIEKPKYSEQSYTFVTERMYPLICKKNSKAEDWSAVKKKRNFQSWAEDVEKCLRLDNRDWEDINMAWDLVEYLEDTNDKFKYNIQSGKNFRYKLGRIMENPGYGKKRIKPSFGGAVDGNN